MKTKQENTSTHLSIDLITPRTNMNSKSLSNLFSMSPSSSYYSNSTPHHHLNIFNYSSYSNNYNYDNINLSRKLNIIKLKREHFNHKLHRKEVAKKSLDLFHKTILKDKLNRNYSSLFLTKTNDYDKDGNESSMPLLTPIPQLNKIELPRTGLSYYKVYPIETAKEFTLRCCDIARVAFLTKEQRRTLLSLQEEESNKIDGQIEKRKAYVNTFNSLYNEYKETMNGYLKFLRRTTERELDRRDELQWEKAIKLKERNHLNEVIERKKEIYSSMNSIRTILICAKEAITLNADKSNANLNSNSTPRSRSSTCVNNTDAKILFQDMFQLQTSGFFINALNRFRIDKSLNEYFSNKYRHNPFVFSSAEEFFQHVSTYESKILSLMSEYDKRKSGLNELKKQLVDISLFCNNNTVFEQRILNEKQRELELVISTHNGLMSKKDLLTKQRYIKIKRKDFKVPANPSYLTSNQSDSIVLAFKYNSLNKEYPIPFTCVYAKLLEIIRNIEVNAPVFLCFDNTTAFCPFDAKDLHEVYAKKFNKKNEEEVTEILLELLKMIERSFKEIRMYYREIKENKNSVAMMARIMDNTEKEKKIIGMAQQRETVDTIRKLIMKNVDEKSHKFSVKQKRKVNVEYDLKGIDKQIKLDMINKRKYEEGQFVLEDFLFDIDKDKR